MEKILILTNSINGLYSFRKELVINLLSEGYKVMIASPKDDRVTDFEQMNCLHFETPIQRRGTNPFQDILIIKKYIKVIREFKPDLVLTYTIKPNIYGGMACRLLKVPYISNITGLGTSIENGGILNKLTLTMYKFGLKNANKVFFQNIYNHDFFIRKNIVGISKSLLVPGSGVNLEYHKFEDYPDEEKNIRFLFIGRMMKAKGINELLIAIKTIKEIYPNVYFDLVGRDEEEFSEVIKQYEQANYLKSYGQQKDIHLYIKNSHALINPSYHEGMSNVLLETASTGRPVLASQIPGCIETFEEGLSGIGFKVQNAESLINSIIKFIELPYEYKKEMGENGRKKIEKEFDRKIVINKYMTEIRNILN